MKKVLLGIFVFGICGASFVQGEEEKELPWYVQPCESWNYNSEVRGYICNYHSRSIRYVEDKDHERALNRVAELERAVSDLDARIQALENPSR